MVIQADSADQALLALDRHPEIRAIFTDVAMPGSIDGAALAARVHQTHPHVTIIVTSGEQLHVADELPDGVLFVPKPYTGHDIIRLIGEASPDRLGALPERQSPTKSHAVTPRSRSFTSTARPIGGCERCGHSARRQRRQPGPIGTAVPLTGSCPRIAASWPARSAVTPA